MTKVGVVTGFVPLKVKHLTRDQFSALGSRLKRACADVTFVEHISSLDDMWLLRENPPMVPANPVPGDRYAGPIENVLSNIVQHNRTEWALRAAMQYPDIDVWVWLDYGILKQGAWRNEPVTEDHVSSFLKDISETPKAIFASAIPFPGITADIEPVQPSGNNWRFCGSCHIWPNVFLPAIGLAYQITVRKWIAEHKTTPLDLPIWALVEQRYGGVLPFKWYQAEYGSTQLTGFKTWRDQYVNRSLSSGEKV